MRYQVLIGLGSNLNGPVEQLTTAIQTIAEHRDIQLNKTSSFYQSHPQGPQDQDLFINAVIFITTTLKPDALLLALQAIETDQGKVKLRHWGERCIDLDILFIKMDQQFNLSLGLNQKWLFRLDDLDRDISSCFYIFRSDNLAERTFPYPFFDSIPTIKELSASDNIIIVLVVPTMIVRSSFSLADSRTRARGFCLFFGSRRSSRFAFFVINSIDVLVCVDERYGKLNQRAIRWQASSLWLQVRLLLCGYNRRPWVMSCYVFAHHWSYS
jgi:2-amino-4-hydroxy-6-hydroxymethyldihydropteridine diphosphokinase